MAKIITIEMGCNHNNGRSQTAEAFANQFLALKDVKDYKVISSGTQADEINAFLRGESGLSEADLKATINLGLEKTVFRPNEAPYAKQVMESDITTPGQKLHLERVARIALDYFVKSESEHRTEAFNKFGLILPTHLNVQTRAKSDISLFLGMGSSNLKQARQIYSGQENRMKFETLAGYAQNQPGLGFTSAFGKGLPEFMAMAETIRDHTYKAMEKALNDPSLK